MKNINSLLPSTTPPNTSVSADTKTSTSAQEGSANVVNELFNQLMMIKTGWRAMFPSITEPEQRKKAMGKLKVQFMKGLVENKITTIEQIEFGLIKARADPNPFFPSVGEFVTWCTPSHKDFGLPTPAEAWREASTYSHMVTQREWKVPAVYEAGRRSPFYGIRDGQIGEKQFCAYYETVCKEVMAGAVFAVPEYETKNRLTVDAKKKRRDKTEQNMSAHQEAMNKLKF